MTPEEIIAMANTAAVQHGHTYEPEAADGTIEFLGSFAALVAAKERERVIAAIKFHPSASHVSPDFRDLFNKTVDQQAASTDFAIRARGTKEGA